MAIVTFDHYKYTPEQALGSDLVSRATDIHHNGDLTVTIEGVTQAEADAAIAVHLVASAKAIKNAEINAWRDAQENVGLLYAGTKWDSDAKSFSRISSVALAGIAPPGNIWTDYYNNDVPMTAQGLQGLYAAMVEQGGKIHIRQRVMKTEVCALTSLKDVEEYRVGWP